MDKEPIPTQFMLKGVKAETFVDSEFLGELNKIFTKYRVVNITLFVEDGDKKDVISIGYPAPIFEEKNELIVGSQFPNTLEKIIQIITEDQRIYEGEQNDK